MSYEGYDEYITKKGRFLVTDCYSSTLPFILEEGDKLEWWHPVDTTNDEGKCADKEVISSEDTWHKDHYGNVYATKVLRYRPVGSEWIKLK